MSEHNDLFGPEDPEEQGGRTFWEKALSSAPLWVSIWAMVVAIVCFILALNARNEIYQAQTRMDHAVRAIGEARDTVSDFKAEIGIIEQRMEQQQRMLIGRINEVRHLTQATETALENKYEPEIRALEEALLEGFSLVRSELDSLASGRSGAERVRADGTYPEATGDPSPEVTEDPRPEPLADEDPSPDTEEEALATYVVRPGDNMTIISRRLEVSLDSLIEANPNINPDVLRVGQVLQVPASDD